MPASSPAAARRARKRVFATTPPPSNTVGDPTSFAAAIVFDTCTSTIASWKLAARSGRCRSWPAACAAFTWRNTAVFSPLIEKS